MREIPVATQNVCIWSTDSDTMDDFMECLRFCAGYVAEYRTPINVFYSRHDRTYKAVPEHMENLIKKDGFDGRVSFWRPL